METRLETETPAQRTEYMPYTRVIYGPRVANSNLIDIYFFRFHFSIIEATFHIKRASQSMRVNFVATGFNTVKAPPIQCYVGPCDNGRERPRVADVRDITIP